MAEIAIMVATKVGASAAAASTVGTIAQVGLTAAGALSSLSAGNQQSAAFKLQSQQAELNARAERLKGRQQALNIQSQLDQDLASQNAIFAARGQLAGEGSAAAASSAARDIATANIKQAQFGADISALNAEQRAANLRSEAKSARTGGIVGAAQVLSGFKTTGGLPSRTGLNSVPIPVRKPLSSGL